MTMQLYMAIAAALGIAGLLAFPGAMGYRLRTVRLKFAELVLFLAMAAIGIIGYGDKLSPTNNPPNGLNHPMMMMFNPQPAGSTVTETDVARGFSVVSVGTNEVFDFAMPTGGVRVAKWWLRGGSNDKAFVPGGIAMIGGEILDRLPHPTARYCPLKATSLLVAGESEFWHQQTVSNSTVYTWKDAYLWRNLSLPFSMQAELFGNGDFEYRYDLSRISDIDALTNVVIGAKLVTNELDDVSALLDGTNVLSSIRFRRLSEFDWDDDGLANEIDPEPYASNGDCHGQGEGWVAACCTNTAEIAAAGGYANWVGTQVGTGLQNGLYKLIVSVPETAAFPTMLTVGDYRVVATNAAEYAFLLEKGFTYQLATTPNCANAAFSATDDMAAMPRTESFCGNVQQGMEYGHWIAAGGGLSLSYPSPESAGHCRWSPVLCGHDDLTHIGLDAGDIVFRALVSDWHGDMPVFSWTTSAEDVDIASPHAEATAVSFGPMPDWRRADLLVSADFGGETLTSGLRFSYGTNDSPRVEFSLSCQEVLFLNDDARPERVYPINLTLDCPGETNGFVTLLREGTGDVVLSTDEDMSRLFDEASYEIVMLADGGTETVVLYASFTTLGSGVLKAVCELPSGECLTSSVPYNVIEPLQKLITNERNQINRQFVNPSRLVYGTNTVLKVGVNGNFRSEDVRWSVVSGPGRVTPTNEWMAVVEATATTGTVVVEARFNEDALQPHFTLPVVMPRVIPVKAFVVHDAKNHPAATDEEIAVCVLAASMTFSQVGISFNLQSITHNTGTSSDWTVVPEETSGFGLWKHKTISRQARNLVDTYTGDDCIELYFVGSIAGSGIAFNIPGGIIIGKPAVKGITGIGHEIGHYLGLSDIYVSPSGTLTNAVELNESKDPLRAEFFGNVESDWAAGSGRGFRTSSDMLQFDIYDLLMHGEAGPVPEMNGRDIPSGAVHGLPKDAKSGADGELIGVGADFIVK